MVATVTQQRECTFKHGENGKIYVLCTLPQFKNGAEAMVLNFNKCRVGKAWRALTSSNRGFRSCLMSHLGRLP